MEYWNLVEDPYGYPLVDMVLGYGVITGKVEGKGKNLLGDSGHPCQSPPPYIEKFSLCEKFSFFSKKI